MKLKLKIFLSLIFLSSQIKGQYADINAQVMIGCAGGDDLRDVSILSDQSFCIAGLSVGGPTGDKTEPSYGMADYWVLNLDEGLNVNWQKSLGGSNTEFAEVVLHNENQIWIAGHSDSPASGNKFTAALGSFDFWVVMLNYNGQILNQRAYGGSGTDRLTCAHIFPDGTALFGGSSDSDISGTKTDSSRGFEDYWLVKVNENGDVIWDKTYGGSETDRLYSIVPDSMGNIFLIGESYSGVSGEKTGESYGDSDLWIVKVSDMGEVIWDKTFGGSGSDNGGATVPKMDGIIVDQKLYTLCKSDSEISGTKTSANKGEDDFWVNKLSLDGELIWDRSYGSESADWPSSMEMHSSGVLLLTGSSTSGMSGDNTSANNGFFDYWTIAIDLDGSIIWQNGVGGDDYDHAVSIKPIGTDGLLVAGTSRSSSMSGDLTVENRGGKDFWLVELTAPVSITEDRIDAISIFPNPTINEVRVQSNDERIVRVEVYDLKGSKVKTMAVNSNEATFDLGFLPPSIYHAKVFTDKGVINRKIAVQGP